MKNTTITPSHASAEPRPMNPVFHAHSVTTEASFDDDLSISLRMEVSNGGAFGPEIELSLEWYGDSAGLLAEPKQTIFGLLLMKAEDGKSCHREAYQSRENFLTFVAAMQRLAVALPDAEAVVMRPLNPPSRKAS